ncbi:hypothetical protein BC936DRAFT_149088 [Jimgerdemannia flammicorona]|uniref:Uncharacterized protein n=1 Tax=Jimgerdemannia flammicorona TaxID=994334 RepID=A0A433D1K8_9FUNG|nr:hypothetical protein BC936DRAFT_149088 [Jimgerdemannia flammicorona]
MTKVQKTQTCRAVTPYDKGNSCSGLPSHDSKGHTLYQIRANSCEQAVDSGVQTFDLQYHEKGVQTAPENADSLETILDEVSATDQSSTTKAQPQPKKAQPDKVLALTQPTTQPKHQIHGAKTRTHDDDHKEWSMTTVVTQIGQSPTFMVSSPIPQRVLYPLLPLTLAQYMPCPLYNNQATKSLPFDGIQVTTTDVLPYQNIPLRRNENSAARKTTHSLARKPATVYTLSYQDNPPYRRDAVEGRYGAPTSKEATEGHLPLPEKDVTEMPTPDGGASQRL